MEKNRVLVTGGAGFVGSHLCDFLVARGDHVSVHWVCVGCALGVGWVPATLGVGKHWRHFAVWSAVTAGLHHRCVQPAMAFTACLPSRPSSPPPSTRCALVLDPPPHPTHPPRPPACQVICLDNFFTGSKDNIAHLLERENFELIRHDVVEPILLEVDQIFHLACPASPVHYK